MARTPAQQAALIEYVTQVQHALGFDHWEIWVSEEEPGDRGEPDTVLGMTNVEHFGYRATILFRDDAIFGDDRDETRRVIVHEVAHLFIEHWALDVDDVLSPHLSPAHATVLERHYERSIEAIVSVLVRQVPLPDWE